MIFDLHNDFPTAIPERDHRDYIAKNADAVITAAIWTSDMGDSALENVRRITDKLISFGVSRQVRIAIEDIGFSAECDGYENFEFDKYLYCSLTWNRDNAYAGGALDDGTLTDKGVRVIKRIESSGCTLDLAHLNKKSFYAALDCVQTAVCSHTGFNGHKRSLDDSQIRELIAHDGLVGLCTVTAFTDITDADGLCATIDGFVQKHGARHLAFGTDFYGSRDIPECINDYDKLSESVKRGLKAFGYPDADIDGILFSNANDFFTRGH